jgi:hypothetical protein
MSIDSFVLQSESYDDASTFTQTSAATAAASKTAAPPVSVRKNSRNGVSTLRAQAVRPEKNAAGLVGSLLVLIGLRQIEELRLEAYRGANANATSSM